MLGHDLRMLHRCACLFAVSLSVAVSVFLSVLLSQKVDSVGYVLRVVCCVGVFLGGREGFGGFA